MMSTVAVSLCLLCCFFFNYSPTTDTYTSLIVGSVRCVIRDSTATAPSFPDVWEEIAREYLEEFDTFVAHNAPFDRSCLERTAELYEIELGELKWDCSLKRARQIYDFESNSLASLCDQLQITRGRHHRAGDDAEMCARLYLREWADATAKGRRR